MRPWLRHSRYFLSENLAPARMRLIVRGDLACGEVIVDATESIIDDNVSCFNESFLFNGSSKIENKQFSIVSLW